MSAKKGDVIGIARIAAIQGAKRTAELVPLCHPLPITKVAVEIEEVGQISAWGNGLAAHASRSIVQELRSLRMTRCP